jgi:hypothetical protein
MDSMTFLPSFHGLEGGVLAISFLPCDSWATSLRTLKDVVIKHCPLAMTLDDLELQALLDLYFLCYWNPSTMESIIPAGVGHLPGLPPPKRPSPVSSLPPSIHC